MEQVRRQTTVRNKLGMHARAAVRFVQEAGKFSSEITVFKDGEGVNGKSILGLLTLVAARGTALEILAEGEDAQDAAESLGLLVDEGFDEGVAEDE